MGYTLFIVQGIPVIVVLPYTSYKYTLYILYFLAIFFFKTSFNGSLLAANACVSILRYLKGYFILLIIISAM